MRFLTWLSSENRSDPAERRRGHSPARRRAAVHPRLEVLEGRRVLSTLTVTNSSDYLVGCLRGEIAAAQPGDTIVFDPSLNGQAITLGGYGQLEINKNLTIQGPGASLLAINANSGAPYGSRVFKVDAGANVTISGLTIEGGDGTGYYHGGNTTGNTPDNYDGYGGGILNLGTMTISDCNVTRNQTWTQLGVAFGWRFEGGGIYNHGTMTLSDCNVTGNSANADLTSYGSVIPAAGGGIFNDGTMTLSGCAVTGNTAGFGGGTHGKGGGIFNDAQGQLTILSSVVLNNKASDGADICDLGWMQISTDSSIGRVTHK
jgi:hypothetical protein